MDLNVNIAGTHGGISVGGDGATHQALEEIALMRIIPNMVVVVPADSEEAYQATMQAAQIPHPVYLRLGRESMPVLESEGDFKIGKAVQMSDGNDITLVACGHLVWRAMHAADKLRKKGVGARVINLHTPKPIDKETLVKAAEETGAVITLEEHTVYGGMGSAVAEVLVQERPVPMKLMGITGLFGESGFPQELFEHFGLTDEHIVEEALKLIERKN
jgi:transketolase